MNQNKNNKKIAKNTLFLYMRSFLMLIIGLYTSRVTLQVLGVEDFGIYNLVGGVVSMFSILYSAMSSASQRYITFALGKNDYDEVRRVFVTSVTLHFIIAFVAAIIIEFAGLWFLYNKLNIPDDRLFAASWVLHFSALTTFVKIICVPYDSLIVAHERMSAFAYVGIFEATMKLIICWFLLLFHSDKLILYAFLQLCISLSLRLIYNIYSHKNFEESRNIKLNIDKKLFYELFSFSGWNLIGNGSLLLRNQGIDILSNMFFGVTVNAARGVSNQLQHAVMTFVGNFQTAVKPQLTKALASQDYDRVFALINQGTRLSFFLLAFFAIPIVLCASNILNVWLDVIPQWSVIFSQLTFCYLLLDTCSRLLTHTILSTGNIKNYQLLVGGTKLLALPIAYIVFLLGGNPTTGLWVNIFLEIVCLGERLYYNKKQVGFPITKFISLIIGKCWLIVIFSFLICYIIKSILTNNILIIFPLSIVVNTIIILFLGISKKERIFVITKISNKLKKNGK